VPLVSIGGRVPEVADSAFIAEGAFVIGDVRLAADSSVWFQSVLRGDINRITVGERTNIQDGCVFHVTQEHEVRVGSNVTVGHRAIVHGCTIGDMSLIGMGAVLLDDAMIGENVLVAAGSVVREHAVIPPGSLVAGVPARVVRQLTEIEVERIRESAAHYVEYSKRFRH